MYHTGVFHVLLLTVVVSEALICYVGSKGIINGVLSSNFVENTCEDGMTHCFESYSDDLTDITASCQTPNTEQKLLDVCKVGCQNHTDLQVTVCCCDTDLCNLPDSEKSTTAPGADFQRMRHKFGALESPKLL
ncbi:hypothetical protein ANCDUO_02829 [Ancylostoma duodenale]|uniref:Uncharacterized protein n=1 Tax=Ancylostoma duodenale TaxID=51022 RepID=A0A0C2GZC8_9BILA|nr:hypothetical protein ANCDUO_02829 [Ancylostoma duodenale]